MLPWLESLLHQDRAGSRKLEFVGERRSDDAVSDHNHRAFHMHLLPSVLYRN